MEYNAHKRLKNLFLKNQSVAGFDPDEIYTAVDYITSHFFKLFHVARKHKEQYTAIVSLLTKLMQYEDIASYEKDISQGVRKGFSEKQQRHAESIIKIFLDLYQLYTKNYTFYTKQFSLVFMAKDQKQHEKYMNVVSSIFKEHVEELNGEIKAEKNSKQTQTSSNAMLFTKKDDEEKEADLSQQFFKKKTPHSITKGNI